MKTSLVTLLAAAGLTRAHIAAWGPGMYCRNGTVDGVNDQDNSAPVPPLYNLPKSQWWFQADRGCSSFPPDDGDFLELPAGGSFTVELANNRAFTTLSWDGTRTSEWPDGADHPEDWNGGPEGEGCIPNGFMHTQNQSMAAGTAWAIAYESDLNAIAMEDLVVFSVLDHTPWKRIATYDVPAALPACPPTGCTCAWLWVANGCGEPNMYMQGYKCQVTGATSTTPLSKAQPPVLCEDDSSKCVQGAKQMVAWNQQDGNNVEVRNGKFPTYSQKCGWKVGAQADIFG